MTHSLTQSRPNLPTDPSPSFIQTRWDTCSITHDLTLRQLLYDTCSDTALAQLTNRPFTQPYTDKARHLFLWHMLWHCPGQVNQQTLHPAKDRQGETPVLCTHALTLRQLLYDTCSNTVLAKLTNRPFTQPKTDKVTHVLWHMLWHNPGQVKQQTLHPAQDRQGDTCFMTHALTQSWPS